MTNATESKDPYWVFMKIPNDGHMPAALGPDLHAIWWTPSWTRIFPPHHRTLRFFLWWIFDRFRVFRNSSFAVAVIEDARRNFVARVCVFPAWWQVPFMAPTSVQLGDIYTEPNARQKGIARASVEHALSHLGAIEGPIYYVARMSNLPSHALARSCGFRLLSAAPKSRLNFLGRYYLSAIQAGQTTDFSGVTELADEPITRAQLYRLIQRYVWAAPYCVGRDVLDVACGSGAGIGLFAAVANRVCAGDIDLGILLRPAQYYDGRAKFLRLDATTLPFDDRTFDVIVFFEAIYYLPDARAFFEECRRVLRSGGILLLSTANKDLYDFNRSPMSKTYLNAPMMAEMLSATGFSSRFFGGDPVSNTTLLDRTLRLLKFVAARLRIIPGTMKNKRWIKQVVYGKLSPMPRELTGRELPYEAPVPIPSGLPDKVHHFLYCVARRD